MGINISVNIKRRNSLSFISNRSGDSLHFNALSARKLIIDPGEATVLAKEEDGNPVFLRSRYGKGTIYLLTFPIESDLATLTGAFDKGQPAYAGIYKQIAQSLIAERVLVQDNPFIGVTEHSLAENEKIVILINYSQEDITVKPVFKSGWKIAKNLYGDAPSGGSFVIRANDAMVLSMQSKGR